MTIETVVLFLFCASLTGCVAFGIPLLYALLFGFILFCAYGRRKKFTWTQLFKMALSGIRAIENILLVFVLIGMLTALWRAAGTIPVIVCYAANLIRPPVFLLMAFLLNCGVSVLTGTAFGTAATMGVICMTMANAMEMQPVLAGGAILSGIFFGDRCSPVSTSALLVSELTGTNIFSNIKAMCRTALIPFAAACAAYAAVGLLSHSTSGGIDVHALFSQGFSLHWLALLPAIVILVLSLCRVRVKTAMLVSIALAVIVCLTVQHMPPSEILKLLFTGYRSHVPEISKMLDGGGIFSMARVGAIVCLSSSYAGIFKGTGLLDHIQSAIIRASAKLTSYGVLILTAAVTSMIACNQTLAIMLTHQLCGDLAPDRETFAVALEDTAVVIAPLVPWSIASATPLATCAAPTASILAACFLYFLPAWGLLHAVVKRKQQTRQQV